MKHRERALKRYVFQALFCAATKVLLSNEEKFTV